MKTLTLLQLSLLFHLIGLTIAVGTTVVGYSVSRRFWRYYPAEPDKAILTFDILKRFPALIGAGMGLLILSGVGIMFLTQGVFGEQIWFRIKMFLLVWVVINGIIARSLIKKQRRMLASDFHPAPLTKMYKLKKRLNTFYILQLSLFLLMFILGVFKFN